MKYDIVPVFAARDLDTALRVRFGNAFADFYGGDITHFFFDDDYHNDYKLICLNHYRTLPFKGLTYKDLDKITFKPVNLNNFKYIKYQYRQLGQYELVTNKLIKVLKKKYENDIR